MPNNRIELAVPITITDENSAARFIESIEHKPPEQDLPQFNVAANLNQYAFILRNAPQDVTYSHAHFQTLAKQQRIGEHVYANTVRSKECPLETPIGNLLWLTYLRFYQMHGGQCTAVDFYSGKPKQERPDIEWLAERLAFDEQKTRLYRAEDFSDDRIYEHIATVVRNSRGQPILKEICAAAESDLSLYYAWGNTDIPMDMNKGIAKGVQALAASNEDVARERLGRLVEEIKVFLLDWDNENATLLFNHELGTLAWIRLMYPDIAKNLVRIALPHRFNEFRGKGDTMSLHKLPERYKIGPDREEWDAGYYAVTHRLLEMTCDVDYHSELKNGSNHTGVIASIDPAFHKVISGSTPRAAVASALQYERLDCSSPENIVEAIQCTHFDLRFLNEVFTTVIARNRDNPALLINTLTVLIETAANDRDRKFTPNCIQNNLVEFILKLDDVSANACESELDRLRATLKEHVEQLHKNTVRYARKGRGKVDFVKLKNIVDSLLGEDVEFPDEFKSSRIWKVRGRIREIGYLLEDHKPRITDANERESLERERRKKQTELESLQSEV